MEHNEEDPVIIKPTVTVPPGSFTAVREAELHLNKKVFDPLHTEPSGKTKAQRRINLLWESTQSLIAVIVTIATVYVAVTIALRPASNESPFVLLSNAFFLIVGFYFGRTNHQRQGGMMGRQNDISFGEYDGR